MSTALPHVATCPRCQAPMRHETLDGHLGTPVRIDLCTACQSFWFDARESLQLSPASTLKLFGIVGEATRSGTPNVTAAACPRCRQPLKLTKDMQRSTRFEYLKCPTGHGRLTTFFNFLREKNFIKPLSAAQIGELRRTMRAVNCSNCGAPVDLAMGVACRHCGSALSMLDMAQAEKLVAELRDAAGRRDRPALSGVEGVDPALPLTLERSRRDVHAAFDAFESGRGWIDNAGSTGLVGAGLTFVARWLRGE